MQLHPLLLLYLVEKRCYSIIKSNNVFCILKDFSPPTSCNGTRKIYLASCSERLVTVGFFRLTFCSNFFHAIERFHQFVVNKHQPWLKETKIVQFLCKCHILLSNNLHLYQVYLNLWGNELETSNFSPQTLWVPILPCLMYLVSIAT